MYIRLDKDKTIYWHRKMWNWISSESLKEHKPKEKKIILRQIIQYH